MPSTRLRQKLGFQDWCRCAIAATQVAKSLGSLGIITGEQSSTHRSPKAVVSDTCEMV